MITFDVPGATDGTSGPAPEDDGGSGFSGAVCAGASRLSSSSDVDAIDEASDSSKMAASKSNGGWASPSSLAACFSFAAALIKRHGEVGSRACFQSYSCV